MVKVSAANKIVGTLVPINALWSAGGQGEVIEAGTFGVGCDFVDWLASTGQSAWQLLPLHETQFEPGSATNRVPSPYQSYGIGLAPRYLSKRLVDETLVRKYPIHRFVKEQREWLADYAFFCALSEKFGTDNWRTWDAGVRRREPGALSAWREKLTERIEVHVILQHQLHVQYRSLRLTARRRGVKLIGDLPFYLCANSPLVWANQELFRINPNGSLPAVSGLPDNPKALFGRQVWGHPLYRWDSPHRHQRIFDLFKLRLRYTSELFDVVRLDHAKGFFRYGSMDPDGRGYDQLLVGPGMPALREVASYARSIRLPVFAEDSGENTGELRTALRTLRIPGIRVFRFEHEGITRFPRRSVAYTTTHDTESLVRYVQGLPAAQKRRLAAAAGVRFSSQDQLLSARFRDAVVSAPARMVLVPLQDWLLIDGRINVPGTETARDDPNWHWRVSVPIAQLRVCAP